MGFHYGSAIRHRREPPDGSNSLSPVWVLGLLAFGAGAVGTIGGLGGAVLLVPTLVALGVQPVEAAPLGLLTVAAGSLAGNAAQLEELVVNHRLGVSMELLGSVGAVGGALLAGSADSDVVRWVLALTALIAAGLGGLRRGLRNQPGSAFDASHLGEWRYQRAGAYALPDGQIVSYAADRPRLGAAAMSVVGVVAGLTGTSGGFIKTPILTELMHVPVKVAAATTVFMVGITSSAALVVFVARGDLDFLAGLAVVTGGLLGGRTGGRLQSSLSPPVVRRFLSLVLLVVAATLVFAP